MKYSIKIVLIWCYFKNSTATSSSSSVPDVKEYSIRVPKVSKKKYHVMQFGDNVDFTQWRNVKMDRENNMKEFKGMREKKYEKN